jgi:hypothetical protein
MRGGNGTALDRAERLYARLLWLLPGDFRREYGAAMRQTFADLCAARTGANFNETEHRTASGMSCDSESSSE